MLLLTPQWVRNYPGQFFPKKECWCNSAIFLMLIGVKSTLTGFFTIWCDLIEPQNCVKSFEQFNPIYRVHRAHWERILTTGDCLSTEREDWCGLIWSIRWFLPLLCIMDWIYDRGPGVVLCDLGMRRTSCVYTSVDTQGWEAEWEGGTEFHRIILPISDSSQTLPLPTLSSTTSLSYDCYWNILWWRWGGEWCCYCDH